MTDQHEIWVNVTEAAAITGYNRDYMVKLAKRIWDKPETEREVKIRKRSNGYDLWLPDVIAYRDQANHGPYKKDHNQ